MPPKKEVIDRVRAGVLERERIRNISVIAHVDHGKSTLTDSLISRAGLLAQEKAGEAHFMSTREDEQKRTITIKSTSVSMVFDVPTRTKIEPKPGMWSKEQAEAARAAKEAKNTATVVAKSEQQEQQVNKQQQQIETKAEEQQPQLESQQQQQSQQDKKSPSEQMVTDVKAETKQPDSKQEDQSQNQNQSEGRVEVLPYLVNLIDSPGHVDFSAEVTSALRVTDGALVLVDCIEGVQTQTVTVLRQAITERIKPVLFLNKLDRVFTELQASDYETEYQKLARAIESVNVVIATNNDPILGDVTVYPQAGTVGFGSGKEGWGFTLNTFAAIWHNKFNISAKKMAKKLWGDNFWDPKAKKWTTNMISESGRKLERGFCEFVLKPLSTLYKAVQNGDTEIYTKFLANMNIKLPKAKDGKELKGKDLLKQIMQSWMPAADALLEMIVHHLPSPLEAQKYRVENLYAGPQDDEAAQAIRTCDPNGPLMMYVSKMVPTVDKKRFYAFGRVFSGTIKTGQQVRIQGPDYKPGDKNDLNITNIQGTCLMMGPYVEGIGQMPCGNMVGLVGVDQYLIKNGTLTTCTTAHNFVSMKYSVAPIVRVAVNVVQPAHLSKLTTGLKRLAKSDPLVQTYMSQNGEHIVAGCGELHLEICLKDLQDDFLEDVPLKVSNPVVSYCETVAEASSMTVIAKSADKLNRLFMTAEPLSAQLCAAIDSGEIGFANRDSDSKKGQALRLAQDYKWDPNDAKKIWSFGMPPDSQCNVLVDKTKAVAYLNEIKDSIVAGFQQTVMGGVYSGEPLRGVRFNLMDAKVHQDKAHRGDAQIRPATRRAIYACQIKSAPRLLEPMYLCSINVAQSAVSGVYQTLRLRRADIKGGEEKAVHGQTCTVEAFLPVAESFGFTELLRKNTSGQGFPQMTFSHWKEVKGDLTDTSSAGYRIVMDIRKRKGMKAELPVFTDYHESI